VRQVRRAGPEIGWVRRGAPGDTDVVLDHHSARPQGASRHRLPAARATDYPALPYPGARPRYSYVQAEGRVLPLSVDPPTRDWTLTDSVDIPLNRWLRDRKVARMTDRRPLLAYGSNACPSKLVDLRRRCGLAGPVVMTSCVVTGLAAAWCTGRRQADGSVPATLVAAEGRERHFVWWVAPDQWAALNRCEGSHGRPDDRYDLVALGLSGGRRAVGDGGTGLRHLLAYVGAAAARQPMLGPDGHPLLVRDHGQHHAQALHAASVGRHRARRERLGQPVHARPVPSAALGDAPAS
jgi:hypothetical protein